MCIQLPAALLHGLQPPGFWALHSQAHPHPHLKEGVDPVLTESTKETRNVKRGLERDV